MQRKPGKASGVEHGGYQSDGGQRCVLVVDDEIAMSSAIRRILTRRNYQVLTAATPSEALPMLEEHPGRLSLLIADMLMPGMDGLELAQTLQPRHPGLKCLFMSGQPGDTLARTHGLETCHHFIEKPFTIKQLMEKVSAVLLESPAEEGAC